MDKKKIEKAVKDILEAAKMAGAVCVAVVCPLCQSNLDMRQVELERKGEYKRGESKEVYFRI